MMLFASAQNRRVCYNVMKKDELHTALDEWSYTCTKSPARAKLKRARAKAKRTLSKKLLARELAQQDPF